MKKLNLRRVNQYLLLATSVLLILTGYGITQSNIIKPFTLGLLDKPLAFKLHSDLVIFFVIFLALHIYHYRKR